MFHIGKGWSLNLVDNVLWMANTYAGESISAVQARRSAAQGHELQRRQRRRVGTPRRGDRFNRHRVDDDRRRRVRPDQRSTSLRQQRHRRADRGDELKLKDYYTPTNWDWLRKRDLDPNNTPTIFNFKGRELMAASGKECRVYLLDPKVARRRRSSDAALQDAALLQRRGGLPGRRQLGRVVDVGRSVRDALGTRAVLGPAHSQAKFPIMNTPLTKDGGVAAFKVEDKNGKPDCRLPGFRAT